MPLVLVALGSIAFVVLPVSGYRSGYQGVGCASIGTDWKGRAQIGLDIWLAVPWSMVILLTGIAGVEELLEDAADGDTVLLSPLVAAGLVIGMVLRRLARPSPPPSGLLR